MITKWFCPSCCRPVELDHFATTVCGEIVHCDFASAVLADDRKTERVGRVGVSDGFGCPRRKLINETEEVTVNPLSFNSMLTGTAWHSLMENASEQSELCEVEVRGKIAGVQLVGHIDRVHLFDGRVILHDHKHTNAWSFKYIKDGKKDGSIVPKSAKAEHVVALSIYAELYLQTFKVQPDYGTVWYHTTAGRPEDGGGFLPIRIELLPIEKCLSFKPFNGEFALLDLWLQVQGGTEGDWRNLPLAGASQMFGEKNSCSYCSVFSICQTAAVGAPF